MAPGSTSGVIAQLTRNQLRNGKDAAYSPQLPGRFDEGNSTLNSFQPDQESTQQFNTAADEPSWVGDESIDGQSEGSMDSDSRSIELGRGLKSRIRNASGRGAFENEYSEEQLLDLGDNSLYDLTATPPTPNNTFKHKSNDLRKQAAMRRATQDRDADVTKTSDIVPPKTRNTAAAGRRTLSDMHAKINAISDSSFIQPEPQNVKPRSSRFAGATRTTSEHADLPMKFTAGAGLHSRPSQTPRRAASAEASMIGNQTAESFMLPNLPNIDELVSGVRKDGTPVFSRTTKPRSRFTSASHGRGQADVTRHARIDTIALPDEEKAIFTSLQLLKEKVTKLELEKAQAFRQVDIHENEISGLRSQVQMERRLRRPDSGFGTDEDREGGIRSRMEYGQLQASLKTAEDRVERSERKLSTSQVAVKRITQERDSLITQLGVAFYSNEELKETSAQLGREVESLEDQKDALQEELSAQQGVNVDLQAQLDQSQKQHDEDLRRWATREAELKSRYKPQQSSRRRDAPPQSEEPVRSRSHRRETGQDAQNRILARVEQEVRKARAEAHRQGKSTYAAEQDINRQRSRSRSQARRTTAPKRHSMPADGGAGSFAERWLDSISDDGAAVLQSLTRGTGHAFATAHVANHDNDDNVTELSFLDPADLSALRRKLEAERLASRQGRATSAPLETTQTAPRKSSMRDVPSRFEPADETMATKAGAAQVRNVRVQSPATADAISYSDLLDSNETGNLSTHSTTSRRPMRTKSFEEMTSAFILPDITMHQSASASNVAHKQATCTACPQGAATVSIPNPVPVTDRDIDSTLATLRPSQDPKTALATVLKQLQDEIVHLKLELGAKERAYEGHDPAIGKRKRVQLKNEIEKLVAEIEKRSEWVYGLYDVLEGQKEMKGLEETLRSIGMGGREGSVQSLNVAEGGLVH